MTDDKKRKTTEGVMRGHAFLRALAALAGLATVISLAALASAPGAHSGTTAASLRIVAKGFSQAPTDDWISAGAVIRNTSSQDALGIEVEVRWVSRSGVILETSTETIEVIPARTTFYFGQQTLLDRGRAARIEVSARAQRYVTHTYRLPQVSAPRMSLTSLDDPELTAVVKNTLPKTLSGIAQVFFVVFDSRGRVVGGSDEFVSGNGLPRGRSALVDSTLYGIPAQRGVRARGSVENLGANYDPIPG